MRYNMRYNALCVMRHNAFNALCVIMRYNALCVITRYALKRVMR